MSLEDRYARLEERKAELHARAMATATPTHYAAVRVLSELLTMGERFSGPASAVPVQLRVMVRTLRKLEPVLVEEFAKVPPAQIKAFMTEMRDQINGIIEAPDHGPPPSG